MVPVKVDGPSQPRRWVRNPVLHALEPLPPPIELERLDHMVGFVPVRERLPLERTPITLQKLLPKRLRQMPKALRIVRDVEARVVLDLGRDEDGASGRLIQIPVLDP